MAKTFLDDLVECPAKALHMIGTDPTVVQLLTDNPNVDMQSDEADEVFDKFLFDILVRYVDKLLNGSDIFGVGSLTLASAKTVPAPFGFSAREMTYYVSDFHPRRV